MRQHPRACVTKTKRLRLCLLPVSWRQRPAPLPHGSAPLSLGLDVLRSRQVMLPENQQGMAGELESRPLKGLGTSCQGNGGKILTLVVAVESRQWLLEEKTFLCCHHPESERRWRAATFTASPRAFPDR